MLYIQFEQNKKHKIILWAIKREVEALCAYLLTNDSVKKYVSAACANCLYTGWCQHSCNFRNIQGKLKDRDTNAGAFVNGFREQMY